MDLRRDPDELLERLVGLHRTARVGGRFERLELYHRSSIGIRVELDTAFERSSVRFGRDDGIAVRVQAEPGEVRFAATTGADENVVDWALRAALGQTGSIASDAEPWSPVAAARLRDHDPGGLPEADAVESWLRRAWQALCRATAGPARWAEGTGRVEVAWTVESWVADGDLHASRSRTRAWAVARSRRCPAPPLLCRPLFTAARSWAGLDEGRWAGLWADRGRITGSETSRTGSAPLLLTPEASADLVAALARTIHGPGNRVDLPVGAGWDLVDDPLEEGALYGGSFDDSGFPTATRPLADGARVVALLHGPGQLRRASYRDPPAPFPSRLRIEARPTTAPPRTARASSVVFHPHASGDWTVGAAGPKLEPAFFRTRPEELARRCVGAVGERQTDHRGIATPCILLENVELRPLDG